MLSSIVCGVAFATMISTDSGLSSGQGEAGTVINSPSTLENALKRPLNAEIVSAIKKYVGPDPKGIWPKIDGKKVVFGIKAPDAKSVKVKLIPDGPEFNLRKVDSDSFVEVKELPFGTAYRTEYTVDGKVQGEARNIEVYDMPKEMKPIPGVAQGTIQQMSPISSAIYPNTTSEWWVYKSAGTPASDGYALIVFQDGQWAKNYSTVCLDNLVADGSIPPIVAVFIKPSEYADKRSIRWRQYDLSLTTICQWSRKRSE